MRRGFTLLEVIIATAVVGLIGVSIYGAVDRSFELKEEVAEYSERYRQAYVALDRITRELSSAFVSNHVEQGEPRFETLFMGEDDEIRFTAFSNTVLRRRPSRRSRDHRLPIGCGPGRYRDERKMPDSMVGTTPARGRRGRQQGARSRRDLRRRPAALELPRSA